MPQRIKKQLEWSVRSERDLLAIDVHISPDNPVAAEQVVDYIITQAELLTRFPLLGRIPKPGSPRELIITRYPYNLIYRVTRAKIRIVRVIHQSRLYP
ncbi:MAG: type II toxin-antitoxin system RelE/ParE family toxin [Sideroxyarcus sp.]|nr:type II toxin-antitoxin system RelE/ParE family toxin [Sideroxyarcus sp.]